MKKTTLTGLKVVLGLGLMTSTSPGIMAASGIDPAVTAAQKTSVHYSRITAAWPLGDEYRESRLFNHVPGSGYRLKMTSWKKIRLNRSKRVYVDRKARVTTRERDGDLEHETYYRIRFVKYGSATRYWVEDDAFDD